MVYAANKYIVTCGQRILYTNNKRHFQCLLSFKTYKSCLTWTWLHYAATMSTRVTCQVDHTSFASWMPAFNLKLTTDIVWLSVIKKSHCNGQQSNSCCSAPRSHPAAQYTPTQPDHECTRLDEEREVNSLQNWTRRIPFSWCFNSIKPELVAVGRVGRLAKMVLLNCTCFCVEFEWSDFSEDLTGQLSSS